MSASSAVAAVGEPRAASTASRIVASEPISESSCAPMRPSASCSSSASRSPLPSSSMSLVIAASPGRSGGSADAPTGSSARKLTSGTPWCSTVQTRRPFGERTASNLRKAKRADQARAPAAVRDRRPSGHRHRSRIRRAPDRAALRHDAETHAAVRACSHSRATRCIAAGVTSR